MFLMRAELVSPSPFTKMCSLKKSSPVLWRWVSSRGQCQGRQILTENPGKAKVAEFDDLLFGDENVFRFDVSMDALKKRQGKMESSQGKHQILEMKTSRRTVCSGPGRPVKRWPGSIRCV